MIDFRYHVVSIIAVFLALAIGLVLGSAVFGSPLLNSVKGHVKAVRDTNSHLRAQIDELSQVAAADREFAEAVEPRLIDGALAGRSIVFIEIAGTNSTMVNDLRDDVEKAGGRVTGTISLTDKFALDSAPDRDQLGLIVDAAPAKLSTLRARAGSQLGQRLAAASKPQIRGGIADEVGPGKRLKQLLNDLEQGGFISVGAGTGPSMVPTNALFLVAAGDSQPTSYNASNLVVPLVKRIAGGRAGVVTVAPTDTTWRVIQDVHSDGFASTRVSTVDDADTLPGRIATVLTLATAEETPGQNYGTGEGATAIIPTPSATPSG